MALVPLNRVRRLGDLANAIWKNSTITMLWLLPRWVPLVLIVTTFPPIQNAAAWAQQPSASTGQVSYVYDLRNGEDGYFVRFTIDISVTPSIAVPGKELLVSARKHVGLERFEAAPIDNLTAENLNPIVQFALVNSSGSSGQDYVLATSSPLSLAPATLASTRRLEGPNIEQIVESAITVPRTLSRDTSGANVELSVVAVLGSPYGGDPVLHGGLSGAWPRIQVSLDPDRPAERCREASAEGASAKDYLIGEICLPQVFRGVFKYRPLPRTFDGRTRLVKASGECSWMKDTGLTYDFQNACKAHDVCYDLVRLGPLVTGDSSGCDDLLIEDVFAHCRGRGFLHRQGCRVWAFKLKAALRANPFRPDVVATEVPPNRLLPPRGA